MALDRLRAAPGRPRADQGLPPDPIPPDRFSLPPLADMLRIRRRGTRPLRAVGRCLDDVCQALPLSPVRHLRPRLRAGCVAARRALVPALALWALARHE